MTSEVTHGFELNYMGSEVCHMGLGSKALILCKPRPHLTRKQLWSRNHLLQCHLKLRSSEYKCGARPLRFTLTATSLFTINTTIMFYMSVLPPK